MRKPNLERQADRATLMLAAILAGLATLGPFSIDTYMPSFPAIAHAFDANVLAVQQTLSAYLIPFSFMMQLSPNASIADE